MDSHDQCVSISFFRLHRNIHSNLLIPVVEYSGVKEP